MAGLCSVSVGDEADGYRLAKTAVLQKLHRTKPAERAAALAPLKEFPTAESAQLILDRGLRDAAPEVRRAGFEMLLQFKDNPTVCAYLLDALNRRSHERAFAAEMHLVLGVLMASQVPDAERGSIDFLERNLTASPQGAAMLALLIDGWGREGGAAGAAALTRLARAPAVAGRFSFRRPVVRALIRMRAPEAVEALISLLDEIKGETRGDIVRFLICLSGQQLGSDQQTWLNWWEEHKAGFDLLAKGPIPSSSYQAPPENLASYYGLTVYAERLVFVLDTSLSMAGPRLDAAKRELKAAIDALHADQQFSVVAFNLTVTSWNKQLVAASPQAKQSAKAFVDVQLPKARTASYDALEEAFRFQPEAIYFLSDGAPRGGKISMPDQILAVVGQINRGHWCSIYSIGLGPGEPGGPLDAFLRSLAEQNLGTYRRIDE